MVKIAWIEKVSDYMYLRKNLVWSSEFIIQQQHVNPGLDYVNHRKTQLHMNNITYIPEQRHARKNIKIILGNFFRKGS